MNETAHQYLGPTNGNGNGNGHTKIFDLSPKADPTLAVAAPSARRKVCENTNICEAARMLFCYLTDLSLLPGVMTRRGVVKKSDEDLALRFKVSTRTIQNWKRAIESTGEVWLTERWTKNTFPQTVFNITAIVGPAPQTLNVESDDGTLPDDSIFTSNRRRQQSAKRNRRGKFVCKAHGVANCQVCRLRRTPPGVPVSAAAPENPQKTEEIGTVGKILPSTTEINFGAPPKKVSAVHRN